MDSRTILTGSGRGPQEPAAKIKDFRNSHGDARTHWRRENEDGSFNVHRDPRNPHVKDNRLWDYEIRMKKKKLTGTLYRSFKLNSGFAGYCARGGGRCGTRKVSALLSCQGEVT